MSSYPPSDSDDPVVTSRRYLLAVLAVLSIFNQLDRQLLAILLEPIRTEFMLSDVQLGLLSGLVFAVIYAGLSVPAAIWAVRYNRRNLIALSVALWGAMTALSGLAQTFWQLLLGRIGIGVGEAGATPATHAIISDVFGPHERATAMAIWASGVNLGIFAAFLIGGYVGQYYGWRTAFVACGLATIVAAMVMRITVREPPRAPDAAGEPLRRAPSLALLGTTLRLMRQDSALLHAMIGATITAAVSFGGLVWVPSFLVRAHGMEISEVGSYLALVIGLGGALFVTLGGLMSDALRRRDIRWSIAFAGVLLIGAKPLTLTFYLADSTTVALVAFILPGMVATVFVGPALALLHNRVPPTLRPTASAVFLLTVNVIGMSFGPLVVGMMSQWLFAGSNDSLGQALAVLQVVGIWGAMHFIIAGQRLIAPPPVLRTAS